MTLRKSYRDKIREFYDQGFSVDELAIMYNTNKPEIGRVLEEV